METMTLREWIERPFEKDDNINMEDEVIFMKSKHGVIVTDINGLVLDAYTNDEFIELHEKEMPGVLDDMQVAV